MSEKTYNGWANRQTWALANLIANSYNLYHQCEYVITTYIEEGLSKDESKELMVTYLQNFVDDNLLDSPFVIQELFEASSIDYQAVANSLIDEDFADLFTKDVGDVIAENEIAWNERKATIDEE